MTVFLWRIASDTPDWSADDLGGKGAAARGARWNEPAELASYAASSIALAALETRAHLDRGALGLPLNRYLVRIDVPDGLWRARETLARPLAVGWDAIPEGLVSRRLGSAWLRGRSAALLALPSVIIPEEDNILINPAHPDAAKIRSVKLRRFTYDPRI